MNIFCITLTNNEKKYPQISCLSLYDQRTLSMARKNLPGNNCHRTNAPAGYSTLLHRATGSKTSPCFMSGSCSGLMLSRSIVRSCGWEFLLFYTTHTHTNHPLPLTPFIRKLNAEENTQTSPHGQTPYANICWKEKTWQPNLYVSSFYLFLSVIIGLHTLCFCQPSPSFFTSFWRFCHTSLSCVHRLSLQNLCPCSHVRFFSSLMLTSNKWNLCNNQ